MEHIILAIGIETALVVLIERLVCVLDTSEVGDATVNSLQQVEHGQECAIERRDKIDFREWRSHRTDAPCTDFLRMLSQTHTLTQAAAAYMYYHLEALRSYRHPTLGKQHALLGGEHIAFARRTVDENALESVLLQHLGISLDWFKIDVTVCIERCKRSVDKSDNLFHSLFVFKSM